MSEEEIKVKQEPVDEVKSANEEECCVCFKPMSTLVPAAMWCERAQFKHLFCGGCAEDFVNSQCPLCRCPLVRYREIAPNVVDLVSAPASAIVMPVEKEIHEHIQMFRPELVSALWPTFLHAHPFHLTPSVSFDAIKAAAERGMADFAVQALTGLKDAHRGLFQQLVQRDHCFRLLSIHQEHFIDRCMALLPDEVLAEVSDCMLPSHFCSGCRSKLYKFIGDNFPPLNPVTDKAKAHVLCHSESFEELKQNAWLINVDLTLQMVRQCVHLVHRMHARVVKGLLDAFPEAREEAFQWLVDNCDKWNGKIRTSTLAAILQHAPKEWMWPANWKVCSASKPFLPHYTLDPETLQVYRAPERYWQENPKMEKCDRYVLHPCMLTLLPIAPPVQHEVEVDHVFVFRFACTSETVCFSFKEMYSIDPKNYQQWKGWAQHKGIRLDNNVTYRAKSLCTFVTFEKRSHKPF